MATLDGLQNSSVVLITSNSAENTIVKFRRNVGGQGFKTNSKNSTSTAEILSNYYQYDLQAISESENIRSKINRNPVFHPTVITVNEKTHLFYKQKDQKLYMGVICHGITTESKLDKQKQQQAVLLGDRRDFPKNKPLFYDDEKISTFKLNSFTEVPLSCGIVKNRKNRKDKETSTADSPVLSISYIDKTRSFLVLYSNNKLCRFSLKEAYSSISNTWENCHNGAGSTSIPWIQSSANSNKCWNRNKSFSNRNRNDFCAVFKKSYDHRPFYLQTNTLKGTPISLDRINSDVTSLISSKKPQAKSKSDSIIILGTITGKIIKYNYATHHIIESWQTDLGKISSVTGEILDNGEVFATGKHGFTLINVDNCGKYKSCQTCSGSADTSCSWCILEAECKPVGVSCTGKKSVSASNADICPKIKNFEPKAISVEQRKLEIVFKVKYVPWTESIDYECRIGNEIIRTNAENVDYNAREKIFRCDFSAGFALGSKNSNFSGFGLFAG